MKETAGTSIQKKLMRVILSTCAAALLLTYAAYAGYEYYSFRQSYLRQLANTGKIIAANSTAALAFDSRDDANEILASLKSDPHVAAAALYDKDGKLFARFPANIADADLPKIPGKAGYETNGSFSEGFQPVIQEDKNLGTLYIKKDMQAMYDLFSYFSLIGIVVFAFAILFAYILSRWLQRGISKPILSLAETSKAISQNRDYSVRAKRFTDDETGLLTDAFNQMLGQIEAQNREIVSFNQNLEYKIRERTKQLEAANKELEAFSYSVSHDLRAPLRAVNGYTSIIQEEYNDVLDDEGKRLVAAIGNNSQRMGKLIDDLLAFSRLGRKEITKSPVDMNELCRNVLAEVNKTMNNRAEVKFNQLHPAMADRSLMELVMTNLISNAIKYSSKKDKPLVDISSERKNGSIIYQVKDNGAGFDMRFASKLFGVFQRLHADKEFQGTGVGLAIVERIIAKHGGKVWAEGEVEQGATFYFSLPESK